MNFVIQVQGMKKVMWKQWLSMFVIISFYQFLPERRVFQLDEFNIPSCAKLWGEAEKDRHRQHYEKKEEISKLFEEDKHAFLHLPAKEYSVVYAMKL